MNSFVTVLCLVAWGCVAALIAAIAACALRRWHFAARVSRAIVIAGPILLLVSVLASIGLPLRADDPSMKTVVLSQGISEVMNCGGLVVVAALLGAVVWGVARRRLRVRR